MHEIWKAIPGYEGLYEVSNLGQVRRIFTKTKLLLADVETILAELQRGVSKAALARRYHVSEPTIFFVARKGRLVHRIPHLMQTHVSKKGYLYVVLSKDAKCRKSMVHKLVAVVFIGPIPYGMEVNHKNGIKTDNTMKNLEYLTHADNLLHSYRVLNRRGPGAKVQNHQIPLIKSMHAQGFTYQAIANHFHISKTGVWRILARKTYANVS